MGTGNTNLRAKEHAAIAKTVNLTYVLLISQFQRITNMKPTHCNDCIKASGSDRICTII